MANYALWNVRKRHEWLAKPNKKQKMSRRGRIRIGLQAAQDIRAAAAARAAASADE